MERSKLIFLAKTAIASSNQVSCDEYSHISPSVSDPASKQLQIQQCLFFNPRQQSWQDNFRWNGVQIIGLTPVGRATIVVLELNREMMLSIRAEEELLGRHPPD